MKRTYTRTKTDIALIPAYQFHAIKRRYEGAPAIKISQEIGELYDIKIADSTVRWWFTKTGALAQLYREYADQMIDLEIEETRDFIRGNVSKAAKILAAVMARGNPGDSPRVAAAKEFLTRGLGNEILPINGNIKAQVTVIDMLKFLEQLDDDANIPNIAERQALDQGAQ